MLNPEAYEWQPCILKHPPFYDDPWRDRTPDIVKQRASPQRKPVLVYDSKLLTTTDYASFHEAAFSLSVDAAQVSQSARNSWYIGKRYICGYTIQQLFDNMKKHGLT